MKIPPCNACRGSMKTHEAGCENEAVCKGSFVLGTACGKCSRCREEKFEYGECGTVQGRLADLIETSEVIIDGYRASASDKAKIVAALRDAAIKRREYGV